MELHIFNGDIACELWKKCNYSAQSLVWRENYLDGPLPDGNDLHAFRRARAKHLTGFAAISEDELYTQLLAMDNALLELPAEANLMLWFDSCIFDQTMLMRILYLLQLKNRKSCNVFLYCSSSNCLTVEDFRDGMQKKVELTLSDLLLAGKAWNLFQQKDADGMTELTQYGNFEHFPAMQKALQQSAAEIRMKTNTKLFSGKSDDYSQFRPAYPDAAAVWLKARTVGGNVLDVGAGTGIFTQILLKHFAQVAALEPNGNMREKFQQFLPDIPCLAATGEDTGLPDSSFDLITVAQAFHWLDEDLFKKEAMRILRPNGKTAIVWNTSLPSDFTLERNRICQKYCPRFGTGYAGKRSVTEGDAFLRGKYFKNVEVVTFDNPFVMDKRIFEGNMRSRSYTLTPEDSNYCDFMQELQELFERHAVNGVVTELQAAQIYLGSF